MLTPVNGDRNAMWRGDWVGQTVRVALDWNQLTRNSTDFLRAWRT